LELKFGFIQAFFTGLTAVFTFSAFNTLKDDTNGFIGNTGSEELEAATALLIPDIHATLPSLQTWHVCSFSPLT
jgi:hypothetical protein